MVICSVLNFRPGSVNIEPDQTVNSDVMQELFVSIFFCTINSYNKLCRKQKYFPENIFLTSDNNAFINSRPD